MAQMLQLVWPTGERKAVVQWFKTQEVLLEDWRPVFKRWIPNVRRRHRLTFERQVDPFTGAQWTPLTPAYARRKGKSGVTRKVKGAIASVFRGILVLSGALKAAASSKGAPGQVVIMKPRQLVFGVNIGEIYPRVHQASDRLRKDGKPIRRSWLGLKVPEDFVSLALHMRRVWKGELAKVSKSAAGVGRGSA